MSKNKEFCLNNRAWRGYLKGHPLSIAIQFIYGYFSPMKYPILFLLLFINGSFFAQEYQFLQVAVGTGLQASGFAPSHAMNIPIVIEVKAQKEIFHIGLRYQRGLLRVGVDNPFTFFLNLDNTLIENANERIDYINRLQKIASYQLFGGVNFYLKESNWQVDIGYGLNEVRSYQKRLYYPFRLPDLFEIHRQLYPSWLVRLGYKVNNFHLYYLRNMKKATRLWPIYTLGFSYNIGFKDRLISERFQLIKRNRFEAEILDKMLLRIQAGFGLVAPMSKKYGAGATFLTTGFQMSIGKKLLFGVDFSFNFNSKGHDEGTLALVRDEAGELFLDATNIISNIEHFSFYLLNQKLFSKQKVFFYGLGVTYIPIDNEFIQQEIVSDNDIGTMALAGFRSGAISNTLSLHIPLKELPLFLEYKVSLGFNFFKRY